MSIRLDDRTLFGNDAGEDEDESLLMSYFVDQAGFAGFLDPGVRLQVAKGRKGTGKSALLVRFEHDRKCSAARPIILHAVPSSLAAIKVPPDTENSVLLENYWKQVICGAINMQLASEIGFAWTDDQMALVESAEVSGFKGKDLVNALLSRLVAKVQLGGVEIVRAARPTANHEQLLQRISGGEYSGRMIWLLLDDIDTKFQNTPEQQAYVSSFFSACRYLVREIHGIGIRATVRTDVWASLRQSEDLDKFEQYLTDIVWSATQQQRILSNRILAYVKRNEPTSAVAKEWSIDDHADPLISLVFEHRMRWGNTVAPPAQILRTLAGGRPRWMNQLCRLAGVRAAKSRSVNITKQHLDQVMGEFGRRRLADLYREHGHQFSDLQRLVESFSGGARRYESHDLARHISEKYIKAAGVEGIPLIDGTPFRSCWQLAHILFKCDFINGYNREATLEVRDFISYELRPDLLQVETNLDDEMEWEIQPAYRKILRIN